MRHADPPTCSAADARPATQRRGSRWGHFSILWVYAYLLALEVWIVAGYSELGNATKVATTLGRIALTLVLMILTYRGVAWARAVFLVLLGIGVVRGILLAAASDGSNAWIAVILQTGALYALGLSPSVADFVAAQRARRVGR